MTSDPTIDEMKVVGKFRVTSPSSPAMPSTGYQMRVNLSKLNCSHSIASNIPQLNVGFGTLQSNFNDLAFIAEGEQILPHQVIVNNDGSNKSLPECWVKIPYISPSSSKIIYVLAGHPSCNRNAGDKAFELWDDFFTDQNSAKWNSQGTVSNGLCNTRLTSIKTFTNGYAIKSRIMTTVIVGSQSTQQNFGFNSGEQIQYYTSHSSPAVTNHLYINGNIIVPPKSMTTNTYSNLEIQRNASSNTIIIDDTSSTTSTGFVTSVMSIGGNMSYIDWVFVRQYMSTEPTITLL